MGKYVNIYNEGIIPWLNRKGPIYNVYIGDSVYRLLSRDSRVNIELSEDAKQRGFIPSAPSSEPEIVKKEELEAVLAEEKQKEDIAFSFPPEETQEEVEEERNDLLEEKEQEIQEDNSVEILEEDSEEEPEDNEEIEDSEMKMDYFFSDNENYEGPTEEEINIALDNIENEDVDLFDIDLSNLPEEETEPFKKYSKKALQVMTKKELKEILKSRGYTSGEFAPKYHDTVDKLIKKVTETQK